MKATKKIMVLACSLSLLFLLWSHVVDAQEPVTRIKFDHVFDLGAPGEQTMLQDEKGFLWIGSEGAGIFRYDGYELKNYGAAPGQLSNGIVRRIIKDVQDPNILWIATSGGLNRFEKKTGTFTHYTHDPDDPYSLAHNTVNEIVQDGTDPNILWLGTENGLNKFDKRQETFTRYAPTPNNLMVWRILDDGDVLWLGTMVEGLGRFDKRGETFTFYTHDPSDAHSLSAVDNSIAVMAQDKDDSNILWLGTPENGLEKFDKHSGRFTHFIHDPGDPHSIPDGMIGMIYEEAGKLWLGGFVVNNGLTLFDKQTTRSVTYRHDPNDTGSLSSNIITNVFRDNAGILWIVSYSGQVDKYDPFTQNFTLYKNGPGSLNNSAVTAIFEDRDGLIWLGTQGGLNAFDRTSGTFASYAHDPGDPNSLDADYVFDVYQDSFGDLWVSLWLGPLVRFDGKTGQVIARYKTQAESFTNVIQDPDDPNIFWFTCRPQGFARFDRSSQTFRFYEPGTDGGPSYGYLYQIVHDNQAATIWIGGWEGGGLNRFNKQTGTFDTFVADPNDPGSISTDSIGSIYQDRSGTLWIGTKGGGLEKFDAQTETFDHYAHDHGVPAEVNAILEDDDGDLWLSTNDGIVEFSPETETVEKHYIRSDGLQGDAFLSGSALKTRDGQLWFGGTNGANSFYPGQLVENPYVPPLVLTGLTQNGEPLIPDIAPENLTNVVLDRRHNYFEFNYAALNYTQPEKNQYAYMLEGIDRDWYDAGTKRHGRYTHLSGGTYTLRIKGANNDGVWNEQGIAITIKVTPPFWQTWWFITLCAAGAFGIPSIFYLQRLRQLRAGRAAALALQESEERYRRLAENARDVIYRMSLPDGRYEYVSPASAELLGYTPDELYDSPLLIGQIIHPDWRPYFEEQWARLLAGEVQPSYEYQIVDKLGQPRWIYQRNVLVKDDSGQPVAIEGIATDITERKMLEDKLERAQRIESLGVLAGGVAHDLNNILGPLVAYPDLLLLSLPANSPLRDDVVQIKQAAGRAAAVVQDLLTLARRGVYKMVPLNLNGVIQEYLDSPSYAELEASYPGIRVDVNLDPALLNIQGSAAHLSKVVMNLVGNAFEAMPNGGTLTITTSCNSLDRPVATYVADGDRVYIDAGDYVVLRIADTGVGIAEADRAKIFEPFYTKKEMGRSGSGLGLAIVHGVVHDHKGRIDLHTVLGSGTEFVLYFPVTRDIIDTNEDNNDYRGNETVLVIDDLESQRELATKLLASLGYRVTAVASGQAAVAYLEENSADVLVLDMIMENGFDGLDTWREIIKIHPGQKAIIASGFSETERVKETQRLGAGPFVKKPYTLHNIGKAIREALANQGSIGQ